MKSKFIWLILAIVIAAAGGMVYLVYSAGNIVPSIPGTTKTPSPIMTLTPATGTYKVNDTFDVKVILNTDGVAVAGAQAFLKYDPTQLEVQDANPATEGTQITPGTIFNTYMVNKVADGRISLSAIALQTPDYSGKGVFGTVKFKAIAPAAESKVFFDFIPSDTAKTGIAQGAVNALARVQDASFVIK